MPVCPLCHEWFAEEYQLEKHVSDEHKEDLRRLKRWLKNVRLYLEP